MDPAKMTQELERNVETFNHICSSMSTEEVRWKPEPGKWSILEVLNHLCDEERDDFRRRLQMLLDNPDSEWPPIDPVGWADQRDYNTRGLMDSLQRFSREREKSVKWLRDLQSPNWEREKLHPAIGRIKAGDLLASWVVHDLLHLRQVASIMMQYASACAKPYSTTYAAP